MLVKSAKTRGNSTLSLPFQFPFEFCTSFRKFAIFMWFFLFAWQKKIAQSKKKWGKGKENKENLSRAKQVCPASTRWNTEWGNANTRVWKQNRESSEKQQSNDYAIPYINYRVQIWILKRFSFKKKTAQINTFFFSMCYTLNHALNIPCSDRCSAKQA